jgi:hypothetical protein
LPCLSLLDEGYVTVSNNGEMYIELTYGGNTYHMGETLNVTDNSIVNITVSYDLDNGCASKCLNKLRHLIIAVRK